MGYFKNELIALEEDFLRQHTTAEARTEALASMLNNLAGEAFNLQQSFAKLEYLMETCENTYDNVGKLVEWEDVINAEPEEDLAEYWDNLVKFGKMNF